MSSQIAEILIGAIVILGGALAYILVIRAKTSNVFLSEIETAVKPFILQGIFAGEKIARQGLEDTRVKLEGADRNKIADSFYDLLPKIIYIAGVGVVVKDYITQAYFETLVDKFFDETDTFIKINEDKLDVLVSQFPVLVDGQG